MKTLPLCTILVLSLLALACGHRHPKEAKGAPQKAEPRAAEPDTSERCHVKGFTYAVPAPAPLASGAVIPGAP